MEAWIRVKDNYLTPVAAQVFLAGLLRFATAQYPAGVANELADLQKYLGSIGWRDIGAARQSTVLNAGDDVRLWKELMRQSKLALAEICRL